MECLTVQTLKRTELFTDKWYKPARKIHNETKSFEYSLSDLHELVFTNANMGTTYVFMCLNLVPTGMVNIAGFIRDKTI